MEKYVIWVEIGQGIATYQFGDKDYALEMIEQLKKDSAKFTTNFKYE